MFNLGSVLESKFKNGRSNLSHFPVIYLRVGVHLQKFFPTVFDRFTETCDTSLEIRFLTSHTLEIFMRVRPQTHSRKENFAANSNVTQLNCFPHHCSSNIITKTCYNAVKRWEDLCVQSPHGEKRYCACPQNFSPSYSCSRCYAMANCNETVLLVYIVPKGVLQA